MKYVTLLLATAACCAVVATTLSAGERANRVAMRFSRTIPWHANYYHTAYGQPIGLVVPPTANMQTKMGWGVSQDEMVPIYHQAQRAYGGFGGGLVQPLYPTPAWPSHTDQFGVYYVRGPW
ncbi:MAG: hypothetical protein AB7O38_08205 [Pirellulaceae bacterium]